MTDDRDEINRVIDAHREHDADLQRFDIDRVIIIDAAARRELQGRVERVIEERRERAADMQRFDIDRVIALRDARRDPRRDRGGRGEGRERSR